MSARDRDRRNARRPAFRDPRPKLLIVCEGENTEKQYFEQFARFHRNSLIKVEVSTEHDKALVAVKIAKRLKTKAATAAKQQKDANLKYDSVWCVFDMDDHPLVAEAHEMAKNNGIQIALSNPCFELWLLLHLQDAPGMKHRRAMKTLLKKHVPNYDKNIEFAIYQGGYELAVEQAKRLDELAEEVGDPGRNPTTGVYKLTETIVPPKPESPPAIKVRKRHAR